MQGRGRYLNFVLPGLARTQVQLGFLFPFHLEQEASNALCPTCENSAIQPLVPISTHPFPENSAQNTGQPKDCSTNLRAAWAARNVSRGVANQVGLHRKGNQAFEKQLAP